MENRQIEEDKRVCTIFEDRGGRNGIPTYENEMHELHRAKKNPPKLQADLVPV